MVATVRCEEIANEKFVCLSADEVIDVWLNSVQISILLEMVN